ncbi:MAG: OmpA family protein [Deltaproteobacteria bacterium]|nr:OmpA family protein [Deltaproteobacteria bacterium]
MVSRLAVSLFCVFCLLLAGCAAIGSGSGKTLLWSQETGPIHAGHFHCVVQGDINSDGVVDLAAGSFLPGGIALWMGDGNGKWRASRGPAVSGDVRAIALGDLNSDGRLDMIIGGQQDLKGVVVFLQKKDGTWWKGNSPADLGSYNALKCVDINHDGHLDIIGANSSGEENGGLQVWLGDGRGNWTAEIGPDAAHIYRDVAVTDLNGDGRLDLVGTTWGHPGGIRIFLGSGDGAWSAFPSPAKEGDFWGVTAADLNGDGRIDIAATTYYHGIRVWYGNGQGGWEDAVFPVNRGFFWDVDAADFNRDGRMDLAATSVNSRGVRLWLASRAGGWLLSQGQLPEGGSYYGLAVADVDGDGNRDLVAASYSEGVQVWLGGRHTGAHAAGPTVAAEPEHPVKPYRAITRFGIPFKTTGIEITDAGQSVLAELIHLIRISPSVESIRIEGHAQTGESVVDGSSLMALSRKRADAVRDLLAGRVSIPSSRISTVGFADGKPVSAALRAKGVTNRRVDVVVTHLRSVDDGLAPGEEDRKKQKEFQKNQMLNEYRIGPGDILKITFWKQFSADEYEVPVRPDGTLSFSMVDDLKVSGLTITELDHLLTKQLSRYFKHPRVDILIKEHHSQEVILLGAINSLVRQPTGPGIYTLTKPTRIVELVTLAGGPKPTANLKKIAVTRKNGTTLYVNLYKAIFQSDLSQNIPVYPGDSIFIPETSAGVSKVFVFGEVKNPGVFDLKEGMNVLEAVGQAGSFTKDAVVQSVRLIRGDISRPEVIPVNLKHFFRTGDLSDNLTLRNNDIIYVPRTKIAGLSHFLQQVRPALDLVLFPYNFEALRTTIDLNRKGVRTLTK